MLIQKIINAKDFDSHKRYKVGSIVIFENGYYINFSGRNSNPDTPEDWLYIGEKDKFSSFASVDASNDINVQNWRTKLQIPDMVADDFLEKIDYTNSEGLIIPEKILLPSYVDDVIEGYFSNGDFYSDYNLEHPITGEQGKLYLDLETSETYRWTGNTFAFVGTKKLKVSLSDDIDGINGYQIVNSELGNLGFYTEHFNYNYTPDGDSNVPTISLKKNYLEKTLQNINNFLPKWASNGLTDSLIYDNGTNVGIGTSTPTAKLDVAGIIKTNSAIDFTQISRWAYFGTGANRMYVTDAGMLILNDSDGNQRLIPILPYNSQQLYSKAGMPVLGTGTTNVLDFSTTYGTAGSKLWVGDSQGEDANIIFDVMSNAMNKTSRPFPFVSGNWFYTMVGILGNMVFQIDGDAGVYFFSGAKWEKLGREYLTKRTDLSVIDTEAENEKSVFASKSTYTTTELNAIKQLVYSLKLNNLWQKMEFIYPMVGGTLDSCSKDLISSNNNAYNIIWYNTSNLIVSSLGIKSADVSTNIGYGDTNFIPSSNSVFGSEGYTFVLGDTTANRINYVFGSQAGSTNRTKITSWGHLDISGTCYYCYSGTSNTPKGVYTQQRDVSSCASIFNGSNKYIERYYNNAGSLTNTSIYILSMNGLTSDSSISCKDRLQFCCKHKSLSMAEVQVLKTIIDIFEQSLGRKTW